MDREFLSWTLERAEQHIVQGAQHIRNQRELIARLAGRGHDAAVAQELLREFERTQAMHIADRDRLRAELEQSSGPANTGLIGTR
jgi:hypothetical protein